MNKDVLNDFLHGKIGIEWSTQADLDAIANAIDEESGREFSRVYITGYSSSEWPYMGMSARNPNYVLYSSALKGGSYTPEEFLDMLCGTDSSCCDISGLL